RQPILVYILWSRGALFRRAGVPLIAELTSGPRRASGLEEEISRFGLLRCRLRIEADADRVRARGNRLDLLQEEAAQHDKALIGRGEMLFRMEGDRTLPGLRLEIIGILLMLRRGHLVPAHAAGPGEGAAPARLALQRGVEHVMGVVDRQQPAHRFAFAVARDSRIGHEPHGRQHALDDAQQSLAVLELAARHGLDAALGALPGDLRHAAHQFDELRAAVGAVQDRHMELVWHIVEMMRPVAGDELGPALNMIVGDDRLVALARFEHITARQRRLLLGRPHIGEDQAVALLDRIPGLPGIVAMTPALRFAGLLEAAAFGIEQPAVIAAADAALLDLAVVERGAAMGAARIKQPGTAFAVAEED